MSAIRRIGLAAVAGLTVVGCRGGGGEDGALLTTERDSAGVRIVENQAPDPDSRLEWRIGTEPDVSIGTVSGEEAYQLFRVTDAALLPDGRLLVANSGSSQIRVFDDEGAFLEAWGQEGEGPGEFASVSSIGAWAGDSIRAWDGRLRRMTVFDADGTFGRAVQLEQRDEVPSAQLVATLPDGTVLAGSTYYYRPGQVASGPSRTDRTFGRYAQDGAFINGLGSYPELELLVVSQQSFISVGPLPYNHTLVTTVWEDGVVFSPNDTYEVRRYDLSGRLTQIVRLDRAPVEVTQADIDEWVAGQFTDGMANSPPGFREAYSGLRGGGTFPAFSALEADPLGNLWVHDYPFPGDERELWTVFDSTGRVLGLVETPLGLTIYEIGEDYILGKSTDELDVEYVQKWRLERT